MTRRVVLVVLTAAALAGCYKVGDPAGGSSSGTDRGGPQLAAGDAGPAALRQAHGDMTRAAARLVQLFEGARDEAGARAAAPQIRREAANLTAAMKRLKEAVAALELSGRKAEVTEFYSSYYQSAYGKGEKPTEERLMEVIEKTFEGPSGPLLRAEVNTVLDALLEGATMGQRAKLEQWIQQKNLRR